MRKFHQKTRRGCRQCKSRHIKCDEARPSCRKCGRAELPCSFVSEMPAPRPWDGEAGKKCDEVKLASSSTDSPKPLGPGLYTRRLLHNPPIRPDASLTGPRFGMVHLRLFHYFEHDISGYIEHLHPGFDEVVPMFVNNALENQYLMEQLLAYSAAHRSTTTTDMKARGVYLAEAMKLQTRALALYNAAVPRLSVETCLPMFMYSSLLSHHIVFDVGVNMHDDIDTAISWLTHSIGIHRGLMALAQAAWPSLSKDTQDKLTRTCQRDNMPVPNHGDAGAECDGLLARLRMSGLSEPDLGYLCTTVEITQDRLDAGQPHNSHFTWAVIQDWLVAIPEGYVQLLKHKKPEALVVLAYFSVLLHRAEGHWFVNDLGKRLTYVVSTYLGPLWKEWLAWPNSVTGQTPQVSPETFGLLF